MNIEDEFITAIAIIVFIIIIVLVALALFKYECSTKASMQELEWSFGPIQGCMVRERNGKWVDYARLRYME